MRKGGRCFVSTFEEGRCGMRDGRCARSDAGYGTVDALYRGCRELAGSDTHCEDEQPAAMASSPSSRQAWGFQVGWGRPGLRARVTAFPFRDGCLGTLVSRYTQLQPCLPAASKYQENGVPRRSLEPISEIKLSQEPFAFANIDGRQCWLGSHRGDRAVEERRYRYLGT